MTRFARLVPAVALSGLLLLAIGCGDDDNGGNGGGPGLGAVPSFEITDVNPNSATWDQSVSPRDHLGRVSAWYFGHST